MEKKKIILDIDDVICDSGFLYLINQFLGTNYKIDDFTDYYIDDIIGNQQKKQEFYKYFLKYNAYDYVELFPNAYETIEKLNKKYDIYICSACVNPFFINESGRRFMDKFDWLVKTFPFLDPNKFIFSNAKNMLQADIQIDDRLPNLEGDIPLKFLFTSYHNKEISDSELELKNVVRVTDWKDIERILL